MRSGLASSRTGDVSRAEAPPIDASLGIDAASADAHPTELSVTAPHDAAPPPRDRVVVVAGGDVELARATGKKLLADPSYDPLFGVAKVLSTGDVRFVNLESQLAETGGVTMSSTNPLVFVGPPVGADALARAKITVVSTANNHAWDFGRRALLETIENLDRVGVKHAGTGKTLDDAERAVIVDVSGFRVAFFAVTDIFNLGPLEKHPARDHLARADEASLPRRIAELRRSGGADAVLVSYHGGDEYQDAPLARTRSIVRAAIDAGADAVLGHHTHVLQGIEWRAGKPILYSMGNLLMQRHKDVPATGYGYLARLVLSRGRAPELEVCPFRTVGLVPVPFVGDPGRSVYEREVFLRLRRTSSHVAQSLAISTTGDDGCARVRPADPS